MFNFLNSTILFAAAAALIPLLIHLFSKRRVKVVEFSSLKHLKQMQRRQVRRIKIRQILLLLLRMLIIFMVVLAFARPTTDSGSIGSHASVSAVVLFDNSSSVNRYITDGNLFEMARNRTENLLESFGESDQISLIPLVPIETDEKTPAFTSSATAMEKLKKLRIGYQTGNLQSAYQNAINLLEKAQNLNKEIYIVSDRQRNLLPKETIVTPDDVRLFVLDLPLEKTNNLGITAIDFGGQLILPGQDFDINSSIKNFGSEDRTDVIASLFINDNRIAQTSFDVKAGQETSVKFERSVSRTGFHSGYIEISDDLLLDDNRHYFSFSIPNKFNVLIINGDVTGAFMSLAMAPAVTVNQYWSLKDVNADKLSGINFLDYDLIILAGVPKLHKTYVNRLKAFVNSGRSIFLTYGNQTDPTEFNLNWSNVTGVVFDSQMKEDFTRAGFYTFLSLDYNHPVFSVFNFESNKPPQIKFYTLPKMHTINDAKSLLYFTGNHPALVESTYGKGKVLTFTGPMSPEYSDMTTHAFFVPFISRVAEYLASDLSSYDLKLYASDNIRRSVSLKGSINTSLELTRPDSAIVKLPPEEEQGALTVHAQPTELPGVYSLAYLGREIDRFAVNLTPEESDLSRIDSDQIAKSLGASSYNELSFDGDIAESLNELRYGKELWQIFLWLAALFILIEIFLSRSRETSEN